MSVTRITRRIVLTGFMGAGKSTIGALLAQRLGWEFIDVDAAIELRAGKTVAQIFTQEGETAFRALEAETIREHTRREYVVLALGGGALETDATRELLAGLDQTCVIFLDAPLDVLVARCMAQTNAAERPVLKDGERLLRRFNTRIPYYRNAHVTVATAGLSPEDVVAGILSELKERLPEGARAR